MPPPVSRVAAPEPGHVRRRPAVADVEAVLVDTVARESRVLADVGVELAGLATTAADLGAGGKRLRASFCLWGARAASPGTDAPGVVEVAAALEMFHLGALVHDDVMDRSDLRRGRPTAHRRFAASHAADGLHGDADAFGDAVATLLGDLCFSWADDLVDRALEVAGRHGRATRRAWERMRTETMAGQYLDLLAQARGHVTDDLATRVLRYKSASYTVEHPLVLGGSLAGASPVLLAGYGDLGRHVGEAFQLRDDLLGVFGSSAATGKPVVDDVREGKRTVLIAYAEEVASPAQLAVLRAHLGDQEVGEDGVQEVREVLADTGALARVEQRIDHLVTAAHDVLAGLEVPAESRASLTELVGASAWRAA
jgi:geranylgeranyl diphosphate synthase type I